MRTAPYTVVTTQCAERLRALLRDVDALPASADLAWPSRFPALPNVLELDAQRVAAPDVAAECVA